ncbi:MAG: hypothetical protein AAB657_05080 [Patescibacteria group bacterium]
MTHIKRLLIFLLGIDALVIFLHQALGDKHLFFNLDAEQNLAALIGGAELLIISGLSLLIWFLFNKLGEIKIKSLPWLALALITAGLAFDDMLALHERITFLVNKTTELGNASGQSFNWLLYYTPLILITLIIFSLIIKQIWLEQKSAAYYFVAGVTTWLLSLITELIGRTMILAPTINVPLYHSLIIAEEALELIGASLILIACATLLKNIYEKNIVIKNHHSIVV